MKDHIPLLHTSIIRVKTQIPAFLHQYYINEQTIKNPGKNSALITLSLKLMIHSSDEKDYLSTETIQSISLTSQEIQALCTYAYRHIQTLEAAILSLIKHILEEQNEIQLLLKEKKGRLLEVTLLQEMTWRESRG